jgi:hypothetical protein
MSKFSERSAIHRGVAKPWAMILERDEDTVQRLIGQILKSEYFDIPDQALPPRLQELLDELDRASAAQSKKRPKRQ